MIGNPALRRLASLKLRGALRKQVRRLDRPLNLVFALVGLVLVLGWLALLTFQGTGRVEPRSTEELRGAICVGGLVLSVMTMTSSLAHRGLYLPPAEVELLLAAPVSRPDLVRYRMLASTGRALFGGVVIGLMAGRHMPEPIFGFAGAFLGTLLLPVLGQAVSLLAGGAENRLAAGLARLPFRWINLGLVVAFLFAAVLAVGDDSVGGRLRELDPGRTLKRALEHPWLAALGLPFRPWARAMTATSWDEFGRAAATALAFHGLLFELVARTPIDFRELSLATSADVARRLRRFQRGGAGSSSWEVSRRAAGRRVPWLFGRGPFGAVAWRKSASILRKARGTLFTGAVIVGLLTVFSTLFEGVPGSIESGVIGPLVVALVGTIYLCAGLRFDFREDLDQMEVIKSWPVRPWKLFLATILPEVALVSLFVALGLAGRAVLTGELHPIQLAILGGVPVIVALWASIDNVVFLYAPVRYTPGQDGALHHTGRALLLTFLRLLVFALVSGGVLAALLAVTLLQPVLGLSGAAVVGTSAAAGAGALLVQLGLLVWGGGRLLRRFDVARDRG